MNPGEKVAWYELVVSLAAVVAVTALYPWMGDGAMGAFGLLGLLGFAVLFLRRNGPKVVHDERDQQIERLGTQLGVHAAWMLLQMSLIGLVLWSVAQEAETIRTAWVAWLVWVQFAICYAVKGAVGVFSYRSARNAA